ncbi:MAG: HAD-IA family hydrolase [Bryobacteraceae bacterium]|jgi:HAD superfamily hydrolase (TIGR01509 family)
MRHGQVPRFPVYLFDLDGTLLDSAEDICGAVQQVLDVHEHRPVSYEYLKSYIGRHLLDLFEDLFPRYTPEQIDALVQQYRTFYPARGHKLTRMYPGVAETLAALGGRKAIATTKGSASTKLILEQFGLSQYFDHVQGTDGFPCKPAPDVIFNALRALGAKPEHGLMVGDSAADMEAGKLAGVKTCAVRYGYGKLEDLARFEPDFWVDHLRELA